LLDQRETADDPPRLLGLAALLAGLALATVACLAFASGNPLLGLAPVAAFVLLFALLKLPLRLPFLVLLVIGLTFENPGDVPAAGLWQSPLHQVGKIMLAQLKHSLGVGALVMTGTDLVLVLLVLIYIGRRIAGSTVDTRGSVPMPRPLITSAVVCVAAAFALWGFGLARGGSNRFALWQVQHIVYLPLMFLVMQAILPGPACFRTLARVIVICACVKAALAVWLRMQFPLAEYSTTHHDSMLFAVSVCMLLAYFFERPSFKNLARFAPILILLCCGMVSNDRRLVWAELLVAGICMFLLARRSRLKVAIVRGILYVLPVLVTYVAIGWDIRTGFFSPVGILRSMADSKVDHSSQWRDLENFNLVSTLKSNPIAGTGFGRPFEEAVKLPSVLEAYELEPYLPHNSVLGLWAYTGYIGFTLIWMMLAVTIYFAARAYRMAREPLDRAAALTSFTMIVIYMVHLYGDMGLGTWTSVYLVGLAMVVAGKTAVKVGAWVPFRARRPRYAPSSALQRRRAWTF
jgi:hypothetical protein